jgi:acyl carrier protein
MPSPGPGDQVPPATIAEESERPADKDQILAEIDEMIRAVLDDFVEDLQIALDRSLADLGMESLDIVALAGRIQARYSEKVNFAEFVAGIDVGNVNDLRVGQVVGYIVDSLNGRAEVTP